MIKLFLSKENEEFLEHFGVKGMRWGVRKDRKSVARSNREKSVKKARRKAGISSTNYKKIKDMTDKELDGELGDLSMHLALGGAKYTKKNRAASAAVATALVAVSAISLASIYKQMENM